MRSLFNRYLFKDLSRHEFSSTKLLIKGGSRSLAIPAISSDSLLLHQLHNGRAVLSAGHRYQIPCRFKLPMKNPRKHVPLSGKAAQLFSKQDEHGMLGKSYNGKYTSSIDKSSNGVTDRSYLLAIFYDEAVRRGQTSLIKRVATVMNSPTKGNITNATLLSKDVWVRAYGPRTGLKNFDKRGVHSFRGGSSIASKFTLATIYRIWKSSKQLCPSVGTGNGGLSVRNLSTSSMKFYSSTEDPNCGKSSRPAECGRTEEPCKTKKPTNDTCNELSASKKDTCEKKMTSDEYCAQKGLSDQERSKEHCTNSEESEVRGTMENSGKDYCAKPVSTTCSSSGDEPRWTPCPPPPCPPVWSPPRSCSPCPKPQFVCPPPDKKTVRFWRVLTLLVGLPVVVIMSVLSFAKDKEESMQPRPPFLDVPYMYRITKPFPWGDGKHTLFHNPERNPVRPHGYEAEDPYEVEKKNSD